MKYIIDTSGGAVTVTLPATASNGESIQFSDGGDFSINNLTVARNGSQIESLSENMIVSTKNISFQLVYNNSIWELA